MIVLIIFLALSIIFLSASATMLWKESKNLKQAKERLEEYRIRSWKLDNIVRDAQLRKENKMILDDWHSLDAMDPNTFPPAGKLIIVVYRDRSGMDFATRRESDEFKVTGIVLPFHAIDFAYWTEAPTPPPRPMTANIRIKAPASCSSCPCYDDDLLKCKLAASIGAVCEKMVDCTDTSNHGLPFQCPLKLQEEAYD